MKKLTGAWTKKFDSISMSNPKSFIYKMPINKGTQYILKKFNSYYSLSIHLVDNKTLKTNWDPDYKLYNIK